MAQTIVGPAGSPSAAALDVPRLLAEAAGAAGTGWQPVAELVEDTVVAALAEKAGFPTVPGMRAALTEHDPGSHPPAISTVVSGATPVMTVEGKTWRVARSGTGVYAVVALRAADLNVVTVREGGSGIKVQAAGKDAFGLERVHLDLSGCPVEEFHSVEPQTVEQVRLLAALVVAAGAVERLRVLTEAAGMAARDLPARRSPLGNQAGQFVLADIWRDGAASSRLIARAGDLLAELSGADRGAEEAACVAAVAATEGLVRAVNGLLSIFEHDAGLIPDLDAEVLAAHEACSAFLSNRRLRLRIAALQGMNG